MISFWRICEFTKSFCNFLKMFQVFFVKYVETGQHCLSFLFECAASRKSN